MQLPREVAGCRLRKRVEQLRIVLIEPDGEGGLAHFAFECARALAEAGHSVQLITSRHYELAEQPHAFEARPVMRLWVRSRSDGRSTLLGPLRVARRGIRAIRLTWEWARITRILWRERPEVALFSEILFPHLGAFLWLLRRRGIRLGQICHEFAYQEREGMRGRLGALADRASLGVYRQFDQIFFLSESTRASFHERFAISPARTARIPHGSQQTFPLPACSPEDFRARLGLSPSEPVILFFGGLRPSKGVPDLIEAFACCRWRDRARLVIAGQPSTSISMSGVMQAISGAGLSERVLLCTGYIPMEDVTSYFAIATCVVLPYRSATQSGVLHLAYYQSRPVIATRLGGLAEDVREGESGYLVAPGDPAALAARIDDMLDDPDRARRMGQRGHELSHTEFTWSEAARIITGRLSGETAGQDLERVRSELLFGRPAAPR